MISISTSFNVGQALFVFMALFMIISICESNKYTKDSQFKNQDEDSLDPHVIEDYEQPFRMKKVNLLWTKAKKRHSGVKLADLYADLKIHDNKEATLKKMKAENLDKDGMKEAEVISSYNRILRRYDLAEHFMQNSRLDNEIPYDDDEMKGVNFQDTKLRGMWRRAQQAGFSDEDLNILKEELWHQQMKINEYEFMSREVGLISDPSDNTVDNEDEKTKSKLSPQEMEEKKGAMKQQNKVVREGYLKLEQMQSTFQIKEPLFKDERIHYLWALAQKTNWSFEELESFKDELKHFEHRLSKKSYYDEQLSFHAKSKDGKSEKLMRLKEKRNDVNQKVKKLHGDLKLRLEKALRHTEL